MNLKDIISKEVDRRKTFAIISHPDAGKTTLTEKLLLYGGAIRLLAPLSLGNQINTQFQTGWKLKSKRYLCYIKCYAI